MGLSAPKRRQLIQTDPNNNNWARNTNTFGQKILRAAGWTPGEYLGAKDAAHAAHHTAASASHIKVVLKEDSLGLGARRNNGDQCTGLDAFQDLLGRLNGKSEAEIEVQQEKRMAVQRNIYIEQKFGAMKFVPGGWLVGDQETKALEALEVLSKEQKTARADREDVVSDSSDSDSSESEEEVTEHTATESNKRKADDTAEPRDSQRKTSKKRKSDSDSEVETEKESRKRQKKEKKAKKRKDNGADEGEDSGKGVKEKTKKSKRSKSRKSETTENTSDDVGGAEATIERAAKKSKKEKQKKDREPKSTDNSDTEQKRSKKKRRKDKGVPATTSAEPTESEETENASTPTPTASGTSTPLHHRSRARFIAQKRMAFADPKALAQIFMMKPAT
ncbi:hypothetical protein CONLIGDRAFT_4424 [Coniochaeta ligniaria NRRL 30616]|uniref:PinX1-related protein 1 n=1 Tax=Coniochaeta ligniaria NRRL 30616 TaxID=1408157 RepID=A0A1J7K2N9_9PEZI|nr:hypothetical protein CONLIGDRAFT_4424 [Coniochaeta ligniaria NRRL 30616]